MLDFPSGSGLTVGDTFPDPPVAGTPVWTWDGVKWRPSKGNGAGSRVEIGPLPPDSPDAGQLWWDSDELQLYVWTGAQWVIATNPGLLEAHAIGELRYNRTTQQLEVWNGTNWEFAPIAIAGDTSGEEAKQGEVGELLRGQVAWRAGAAAIDSFNNQFAQANNGFNSITLPNTTGNWTDINWHLLTLTPGDWDVWVINRTTTATAGATLRAIGAGFSTTAPVDFSGVNQDARVSQYTGGVPALAMTAVGISSPPWPVVVSVPTPIFPALFVASDGGTIWLSMAFARRRR